MISLSVTIITFNEEANLEKTILAARQVADELLVVDSQSADRTQAIARSLGARVADHPFENYGKQKAWACQEASHDWILNLDADEVMDEELIRSIHVFKQNPTGDGAELNRLTYYCGQPIFHAGWYPDRLIRLFNRNKGRWNERALHESWTPDPESKIIQLPGRIHHYSYHQISDHLKQIDKFSQINAQEAHKQGKKASLWKVWAAPKWTFFQMYFLRGGLWDGYYGYLICRFSAMATLAKYTKLREMEKQPKKSDRPHQNIE